MKSTKQMLTIDVVRGALQDGDYRFDAFVKECKRQERKEKLRHFLFTCVVEILFTAVVLVPLVLLVYEK